MQIILKKSRISPCTRGDLQIDLQNYPACGVGCETCSQIHTARTVPPAGPLPWALVIEGSFGAQPKDSPHMMSQIQHDATQKGTSHTAASERHAYPYTSVQALARAASPARRCNTLPSVARLQTGPASRSCAQAPQATHPTFLGAHFLQIYIKFCNKFLQIPRQVCNKFWHLRKMCCNKFATSSATSLQQVWAKCCNKLKRIKTTSLQQYF